MHSRNKLVRIDELAQIVNVSTRTLENWMKDGTISVIQIKRVNLFDPDQVIADLKRFERPAIDVNQDGSGESTSTISRETIDEETELKKGHSEGSSDHNSENDSKNGE